jgi:hypothetical protein
MGNQNFSFIGMLRPYKVRTGCGHVVTRQMRPATAGIEWSEEVVIEAPGGVPCDACQPPPPPAAPSPSKWESVAETAKKIRVALKAAFPGTKFSVRSDSYSMGSAVRIRWTDGPIEKQVAKITSQHEDISRDWQTGEILSGGNRYITTSRDMSPRLVAYGKARADAITGWRNAYDKERHGWDVSHRTEVCPDGQLLEWSRS